MWISLTNLSQRPKVVCVCVCCASVLCANCNEDGQLCLWQHREQWDHLAFTAQCLVKSVHAIKL